MKNTPQAMLLGCLLVTGGLWAGTSGAADTGANPLSPEALYTAHCEVCHGKDFEGAAQGVPLAGRDLSYGHGIAEISASISQGYPNRGMPAWESQLDKTQILALAIYISERRRQLTNYDFRVSDALELPAGKVRSERHAFSVLEIADNLDPLPYDMAHLPDGRYLVTEKHIGLSIVSAGGDKQLVRGAPEPQARNETDVSAAGLDLSNGWTLGVALHPSYSENGWVYLSYGDICDSCATPGKGNPLQPSMNKLVRGQIRDGRWTHEQVIWQSSPSHYVASTDMFAGGRIAFDEQGHVFLTIGVKKYDGFLEDHGLDSPWGKILRLRDDGSTPADNPFVDTAGALKSIWTRGHRNPQGIHFDPLTAQLWSAEHGSRGGDEVNLLLKGRHYGWPHHSLGVNYDGTEIGAEFSDRLPLESIQQPVVDFTPSPAVSEVAVYRGEKFPHWQGNLLVASLKARELYRIELQDGMEIHRETLLSNVGRIRDIEISPEGDVDLLIEHASSGRIIRLQAAQ